MNGWLAGVLRHFDHANSGYIMPEIKVLLQT